MEKRERVNKIATVWEEKKTEYWVVKDRSGWEVEFETEELAIKAQEFMDALKWKEVILYTDRDFSMEMITAHFKYPLDEVYSTKWGRSILGYNYPLEDLTQSQKAGGDVKFFRIITYDEYDNSRINLIPIEGDIKEQLINFLKD